MSTYFKSLMLLAVLGVVALPAAAQYYRSDRPGYSQSYRHYNHSYNHSYSHHSHYYGDALAVAALATFAYVATRPSHPVVVERPVYYSSGYDNAVVVSESYPIYSQPVYSPPVYSPPVVYSRPSSGRYTGPTYRYYCSDPAGYSPDVDQCRGGWSRMQVN